MKRRTRGIIAVFAVAALVLSGCRGSTGSSTGEGPIIVGSVNSLSGAATFPEASRAAAAVFEAVNERGGINGRKIKYIRLDDKGDPAAAAAAARQLVEGKHAVAMVGSASLIACQINAKYYAKHDILSIPGIGVDPACFNSPNIAPVNVGPYHDMTLTLMYGSEVLGLDNICALLEIAGNTLPAYKKAIHRWEQITGEELLYMDASLPYGGSDYTSYIVKARQAGCEAITVNAMESDSIAQLKAAHAQGWEDVTWLLLTSVYTKSYANAITYAGNGIYVPAEFYPYTNPDSPQNEEWRKLMKANDIPLTAFAQGGYLAAKFFVEVLKGIEGEITRESVTKALHNMEPIKHPMLGSPYVFGKGEQHPGGIAGWPVKLMTGTHEWQMAADDWLRIPRN